MIIHKPFPNPTIPKKIIPKNNTQKIIPKK